MITLGQVPGTMDEVSKALETGTFYYNDIAFKSGLDVYGDKNGADDADDIFILYEDPANRPFISMRGFIPFKPTFFDLKGETSQVPNLSDTMEYIVQHIFIHVLDAPDRRQTYNINGKTIYQLQVYHGYIEPMLISSGVSHFAGVPANVFLSESNGMVTVTMQNPVFKVLRNYHDLSPAALARLRESWNTADPANKVVWHDWSLAEMGEISLSIAQQVFDAAVNEK